TFSARSRQRCTSGVIPCFDARWKARSAYSSPRRQLSIFAVYAKARWGWSSSMQALTTAAWRLQRSLISGKLGIAVAALNASSSSSVWKGLSAASGTPSAAGSSAADTLVPAEAARVPELAPRRDGVAAISDSRNESARTRELGFMRGDWRGVDQDERKVPASY